MALRRDHQRPVLDEAARIAEVVDVLARRALPGLAPARDRLRARGVESVRRAARDLAEVGAHVIEIDLGRAVRAPDLHLGLFEERQRVPLEDRVAGRHADAANDAADAAQRSRAPSSSLP